MTYNIRHGVFETNSSSMHSLAIGTFGDRTVDKAASKITLGVGEYGWGPEMLKVWLEKADYLALNSTEEDRILLTNTINSKFPNVEVSYKTVGYIDHESVYVVWNRVNESPNKESFLFDLLFGSAIIYIDNDNGSYYEPEDDWED